MEETTNPTINLDEVREKLKGKNGPEFWRSLDEVAETPEFQAWVEDEFPNRSSLVEIDRRSLLKFMGASMVLAGISGCRSLFLPTEKVVPYVKQPEDIVPGKPLEFASVMAHNGSAIGLLVTSHTGRPTKIEGNPNHPSSLGKTDHFAQAALIDLYDPDRFAGVFNDGMISGWDLFWRESRTRVAEFAKTQGQGLYFLTETVVSPTIRRQIEEILAKHPQAKWVEYESVSNDGVAIGSVLAFGQVVTTTYHLASAKVILSLDADFLHSMPDSVRMARDFSQGRKFAGVEDAAAISRLYVVESSPTLTGAMADHRYTGSPALVEAYARTLAAAMGVAVTDVPSNTGIPEGWMSAVMEDLMAAGSEAVVIPGQMASPAVHALCHAINERLGSAGVDKIVRHTESFRGQVAGQIDPVGPTAAGRTGLRGLVEDMKAGAVKGLFILGGNPVFSAPWDFNFEELLAKVPFSHHHTLWMNETSKACKWVTGDSHFLESWSDAAGFDGTVSIGQPLISPIRDTKSTVEILAGIQGDARPGYELVRETHRSRVVGPFDKVWTQWLNDGIIVNPANPVPVSLNPAMNLGPSPQANGIAVLFRPDPTVWDGRYSNNGWMQELPKPLTTLTWDNAALMSPKTAQAAGLKDGDHVEIAVGDQKVKLPTLMVVGHPDDAVTLHLGYGRKVVGTVGEGTGFDVRPLRSSMSMAVAYGGTLTKVTGRTNLALTQTHHSMEKRPLVKYSTVADYLKDPKQKNYSEKLAEEGGSMYPENLEEWPFEGPQWGMTIDLNVCTGCHACVTACQAENNIPVVGKDQVSKGREMHWIRIDRYYRVRSSGADATDESEGLKDILDSNNIETIFTPTACMHCEKAPCEPVCPVAATVHSHEGLNQMVYNRCVGTRYCSNNCPYKVRRFNYLNYTDNQDQFSNRTEIVNGVVSSDKVNGRALLKMIGNPNVTVRGRGVMEKCTYCVQRINETRVQAKLEKRDIRDGEIKTACQQVCPTGAIVFGNVADPNSEVSKLKALQRNYSVLPEINTKNRTTYLTRLRNPNPKLETA